MKLRQATQSDVAILMEIGRLVHAESRFAQFPYDVEKLQTNLGALIELQEKRGSHLCLLAENGDGRLIGCIIGALEEYFFTRSRSASSILLWVDPGYRGSAAALRLLQAFRNWGEKHGAQEVCVPVVSGISMARTDRFLRRLGFSQTGGNYSAPIVRGK